MTKARDLSRKARAVLAVLRRHAVDDGPAVLTVAELAAEARYSVRVTQRALRELETVRRLRVERPEYHGAPRFYLAPVGVKTSPTQAPKVQTFDRPADPLRRHPWCLLPPRGLLYLRHRLALATNRQIAAAYGIGLESARKQLKEVTARLRAMTTLAIPGFYEVLVLAAQDGVPPEPLPPAQVVPESGARLQPAEDGV